MSKKNIGTSGAITPGHRILIKLEVDDSTFGTKTAWFDQETHGFIEEYGPGILPETKEIWEKEKALFQASPENYPNIQPQFIKERWEIELDKILTYTKSEYLKKVVTLLFEEKEYPQIESRLKFEFKKTAKTIENDISKFRYKLFDKYKIWLPYQPQIKQLKDEGEYDWTPYQENLRTKHKMKIKVG